MKCHKTHSNDSGHTLVKDHGHYCYVSEDSYTFTTPVARASQVFAISILLVLCLAANGLMVYAVLTTRCRGSALSASSLLLINLATADLLVGVLVLPMWMVSTASLSWPLPEALCALTAFFTVTLMVCSIFSLSAIALDRYLNLAYPLRYPTEVTPVRLLIVFLSIWTFCFLLAGLPLCGWGEYRFQPQTVPICNPVWVTEVGFAIFLVLLGLALPFALMLAAYVRIVQIAKRHIASIEARQVSVAAVGSLPQHPSPQGNPTFLSSSAGLNKTALCRSLQGDRSQACCSAGLNKSALCGSLEGDRSQACSSAQVKESSKAGKTDEKKGRACDEGSGSVNKDGGPHTQAVKGGAEEGGQRRVTAQSNRVSNRKEKRLTNGKACGKKNCLVDVRIRETVHGTRTRKPTSLECPITAVTSHSVTHSPASARQNQNSPLTLHIVTESSTNVTSGVTIPNTTSATGQMSEGSEELSVAVTPYLSPPGRASQTETGSVTRCPVTPGPASKRVFSKSVQTANRVFVAVGLFFLCWGPYVILNFWSVNNDHVPVPYATDLLTTLLAFANSAINPVLFLIINRDYRVRVRRLGRKCWKPCLSRRLVQPTRRRSVFWAESAVEGYRTASVCDNGMSVGHSTAADRGDRKWFGPKVGRTGERRLAVRKAW